MTVHGPRRLLYLGFAFPPGVQALHPGLNTAGHKFETSLVHELHGSFEMRSVGTLPFGPAQVQGAAAESGIAHDVLLVEKPPEIWHRFNSLRQLKGAHQRWEMDGWAPDIVLVYNFSPVYNVFLNWLRRRSNCPRLVLLLLDSPSLGQPLPWLKGFRRRFKPMFIQDAEMLSCFDGCIGLSRATERFFAPRQIPFLWMPGGCKAETISTENLQALRNRGTQLRFGYFGNLGSHAGSRQLVKIFLEAKIPAVLEVCGHGKGSGQFREIAARATNFVFHGLVTPERLAAFGRECDVLVNPRPATHGNVNNFASKLFDFAMCGTAILTSCLSGEEAVLGPEAYYFDANAFETSLAAELHKLAATSREELARRGAAVKEKVLREFSWSEQGRKVSQFLEGLLAKSQAVQPPASLNK